MIKRAGINFNALPDDQFDSPMGLGSGAGTIFGATGGVMEAALRTAAEVVLGKKLEKLEITVSAHTTDGKKLYGSVGVNDILAAIEANRGIKLERSQLELDDNLKEVGEYNPVIDLGHGVTVKFKIVILDEEAAAE